jgi:hypothetical protein
MTKLLFPVITIIKVAEKVQAIMAVFTSAIITAQVIDAKFAITMKAIIATTVSPTVTRVISFMITT